MTLHHLVFACPEQAAADLVDALTDAGHPAQIATDRAGFPAEPLTLFVEALGDGTVDAPVELAARHGGQLRLHGPVDSPRAGIIDPRIAALEARLALLEGTR